MEEIIRKKLSNRIGAECGFPNVVVIDTISYCNLKCSDIKEQTLREVWNDKLLKLRNFHREGQWDRLPDMCKNCMDWQSGYADYKTPAQE